MKLLKHCVSLKKLSHDDTEDGFVKASPKARIAFIWELTAELWSLSGVENVERRLQRDVVHLTRQQG